MSEVYKLQICIGRTQYTTYKIIFYIAMAAKKKAAAKKKPAAKKKTAAKKKK